MTVPNSLPLPPHSTQHSINNSTFPHDATDDQTKPNSKGGDGKIFTSTSHTSIQDDLAMIITTPSSITECPLLSPAGSTRSTRNPKRAWYKQLKPPFAMLIISCVQVGLYFILDDSANTRTTRTMHALLFDPRRQREPWRFITYMLLHKDGVHLVQNVLLQCLFGVYLETFEGSAKILIVYIGGGIGGALGAAAVCGDLIVGASAGVYALLLSYVSHIILNYNTMKYKLYLTISVGVIIISDVVYCIFHYFNNASPTISGGAHLFGALHGLLLGLILFSSNKLLTHCDAKNCHKLISTIALISLILGAGGLIIADIKNTRVTQATKLPILKNNQHE